MFVIHIQNLLPVISKHLGNKHKHLKQDMATFVMLQNLLENYEKLIKAKIEMLKMLMLQRIQSVSALKLGKLLTLNVRYPADERACPTRASHHIQVNDCIDHFFHPDNRDIFFCGDDYDMESFILNPTGRAIMFSCCRYHLGKLESEHRIEVIFSILDNTGDIPIWTQSINNRPAQ